MKIVLFVLMVIVFFSCSIHKETLKEQNEHAVQCLGPIPDEVDNDTRE